MAALIKTGNASYGRYEELLLKRDQYAREAESILITYTREFGELRAELFREQITCIRLKKMIRYCQISLNRGERIDLPAINRRLIQEMAVFQAKLEEMLVQNQAAREAGTASPEDVERVTKAYHRLAKQLHPDINPMTAETPELMDLWNRIVAAYRGLNYREISELEVLTARVLRELQLGTITVDIPDIEDRIQALMDEINEILTTEPYLYDKILKSPERTERHREELQRTLAETKEYRGLLEDTLNDLFAKGGITFRWTKS